jgi:hypothetical protein
VWQCYETYDSISRDEAIDLFNRTYGLDRTETAHEADPVEETVAPATPEPTATKIKKVSLTNSQRRALLKLAAGDITEDELNNLSRKPFDYFAENGLATVGQGIVAITDAGLARAADIDAAKYGA